MHLRYYSAGNLLWGGWFMAMQANGNWEARLVRGMALPGIAPDVCDALVTALGALGCEAEFGLNLVAITATAPRPTHDQGDQWLRQCYGLCQRLVRLGADVEVATQGYLAALGQSADPFAVSSASRDAWAARFDAAPDVWWPPENASAPAGEPIEVWLRRAGYSYRHCVTLGVPAHIEALGETLHLVLHALGTLPPGGILTRASLALGLETLAAAFQGDLIPHHLLDLDAWHVGLLTGISTLAQLNGAADLNADLAWARGELARARAALTQRGPDASFNRGPDASFNRGPDIPVWQANGSGTSSHPLPSTTGNLWARQLVAEWEHTLAQLEALVAPTHIRHG
jgi:hypothetical protein